ncbi:MAG: N-acetylmuramoyl-L-alanine amidase [Kiritimatiellia bacterium]|jgi:N-acetylmuramoyl-L-alanine amidase|nr:N-acetylmuramoyl-L-alanine amidase [Kiritimatiellia bacterium]
MVLNRSIWYRMRLALVVGLILPLVACAQVRSLPTMPYAGKRYVALKDLAGMYGLPLSAPNSKTLLIRGQYLSVQFATDGREAIVNGSKVWLHTPAIKVRGQWVISDADAQCVIDPLVRPSAYLGGRATRTVVLDPGHGGKDPGASANGMQEKDMVLDLALRVRAHLRANGVRVVMTRETDRFWTLQDRPFLAARGAGDAFVSIHFNATGTRSVQGVETFVTPVEQYPPTSDSRAGKYPAVPNNRFNHSNTVLGHQIQRSLVGITRADDRGLKRARFHVLKDSAMPAALVECGFLTNPQEAQKVATPAYRETLAQGIAQGILNYLALVNRAKVELGAPLIQAPTQVAVPVVAPAPTTPIPMAARAWGAPPPGTHLHTTAGAASAMVQAPTAEQPSPTVPDLVASSPAPALVAPPGVGVTAPLVTPPPVRIPAPTPTPALSRQAVAPPPSRFLNPNLGTRSD